jgi:hypothetical protein
VSVADLPRDITEAGVGVARLIRYDPRWMEAFDASAGGFLRSFAGPILSLPFVVIVAAMITGVPGDGHVIDPRILWAAGLSQLMATVAYPAAVGFLAKPLGIGEGYGAFIVVVNWASFFVNIAVTAATVLLLMGTFDLFGFVWLVLFGLSLFVVWRASRETLSQEIAPSLMVVALWVGVSVATDRLGQVLLGIQPG